MKKSIVIILTISLLMALLFGCAPGQKQFDATYFTLFDTVITIVGQGDNRDSFDAQAQKIYDSLLYYHQLFDIYKDYPGVNNLKTVNDNAGIAPVTVDPALIELLQDCKTYYELTGGKVNVAMGSVLRLWHEARNDGINDPDNACLPDMQALEAAATHISMEAVMIDTEASTVFITDPQASLDVGAIAKGWAVQQVAQEMPQGFLISVGGNVCVTGPKDAEGTPWNIGIQDPLQTDATLHTICVTDGAVVTSGDYQRTYTVDGKQYHHIIDPQTRMPSDYWKSVTIVCDDSGLADALSTALFLMPLEEGKALLETCGAEALWVDAAGNEHMTAGFEKIIGT